MRFCNHLFVFISQGLLSSGFTVLDVSFIMNDISVSGFTEGFSDGTYGYLVPWRSVCTATQDGENGRIDNGYYYKPDKSNGKKLCTEMCISVMKT